MFQSILNNTDGIAGGVGRPTSTTRPDYHSPGEDILAWVWVCYPPEDSTAQWPVLQHPSLPTLSKNTHRQHRNAEANIKELEKITRSSIIHPEAAVSQEKPGSLGQTSWWGSKHHYAAGKKETEHSDSDHLPIEQQRSLLAMIWRSRGKMISDLI